MNWDDIKVDVRERLEIGGSLFRCVSCESEKIYLTEGIAEIGCVSDTNAKPDAHFYAASTVCFGCSEVKLYGLEALGVHKPSG